MKVNMTRLASRKGFSLIEILTVIAIISVVASLGIPAFKSITASNDLVNSANVLSGLMNQARVYAIANNTQTAVYLCTDWPGSLGNSSRAVSAWAYNPDTGNWAQLSKWEKLPSGIIFQQTTPSSVTGTGNYYALDSATLNNKVSPAPVVNGQAITACEIRFNSLGAATIPGLSSGTLIQQVSLRLVPGFLNGGTMQTTSTQNWMDIRTDGLTGRVSFAQR